MSNVAAMACDPSSASEKPSEAKKDAPARSCQCGKEIPPTRDRTCGLKCAVDANRSGRTTPGGRKVPLFLEGELVPMEPMNGGSPEIKTGFMHAVSRFKRKPIVNRGDYRLDAPSSRKAARSSPSPWWLATASA